MLNPFFQQGSQTEQSLIQDLINEQLRMYGVEVYYIPRKYATTNTIIREVIESKFDNAYPIEAYVNTYEGYEGQGTILSKFGVQPLDDLTLTISKERFENYITPLTESLPNIELSSRPKEGDLVYFPLGDRLFEIKFVEHEKPFYQLQKNYVYELTCELFRYEDEVLDTGVDEIDDNIKDEGYIQTLTLVGTAVTSTANTYIVYSGVRSITLSNRGDGYSSAPRVAISSAPSGGITAVGVATMIGDLVDCTGDKGASKVQGVELVNAGSGYTVAPSVAFFGGGGAGAAATASIGTGVVGIVTVIGGGSGYTTSPAVTFSMPKHVGAAATAVLNYPIVGGGVSVVSAPISIGGTAFLFPGGTTGGVFYRTAPTVTFSLPTGTGNAAEAVATLDNISQTGGTVKTLGITTGGKFYTSTPTVIIEHPGTSYATATVGLAGSSIDPGSVAFSTTGRAYRTRPNVAITTSGNMLPPYQQAVGIATIHPITGIVTAVSFDVSDPWAVGTGATVGSGYTVAPNIVFSGDTAATRATATVTVSIAGTVNSISIGNSGYGYITTPTVTIGPSQGGDEQFRALGIANIRATSIKTQGTIGIGSDTITGVTTTNIVVGDRVRLGVGYSDYYNFIPSDTFVTSIGSSTISINNAATNVGIATSVFEFGRENCGIVTGIAVTYGGGGYLAPPTVTISNEVSEKNYIDFPGISTATGTAVVNDGGTVTQINILDGGYGYTVIPEVTVAAPVGSGSTIGIGTFIYNETITGSVSGNTARVREWNADTTTLELGNVTGDFVPGDVITGETSGAVYKVRVVNTDNLVDPYAQNDVFESEGDDILDFTEGNPFGTPS